MNGRLGRIDCSQSLRHGNRTDRSIRVSTPTRVRSTSCADVTDLTRDEVPTAVAISGVGAEHHDEHDAAYA